MVGLLFAILAGTAGLRSLSADQDKIQKKLVGGQWVQVIKGANQVFYYEFRSDGTGHVQLTQNGKKISEYDMKYRVEDNFIIFSALDREMVWEVSAITDSVLVVKAPGATGGDTLRRQ